jgi:hypothetical protein
MHPDLSLARVLRKVTAGTAVALGLLMLAAGLGLGFALLTSAQPPLQFATAAVLLVTGAVNLASSPRIVEGEPKATRGEPRCDRNVGGVLDRARRPRRGAYLPRGVLAAPRCPRIPAALDLGSGLIRPC